MPSTKLKGIFCCCFQFNPFITLCLITRPERPRTVIFFLCIYVGIESRGRCKIWLLSVENAVELRQHVRACATSIDRNGKKNKKKKSTGGIGGLNGMLWRHMYCYPSRTYIQTRRWAKLVCVCVCVCVQSGIVVEGRSVAITNEKT